MQVKTILNRVQKFKSFVYGAVRCVEGASVPTLEVEMQPRLNSRPAGVSCIDGSVGVARRKHKLIDFYIISG
jgi:hypothetical protein